MAVNHSWVRVGKTLFVFITSVDIEFVFLVHAKDFTAYC